MENRKDVADEFMLKEYDSIAAAHFDSQAGLRQQFRFFLIIAAVPLTVLGFTLDRISGISGTAMKPQQVPGLFDLPPLMSWVFLGIAVLCFLLSLSMIHTALDATLYARTVNGIRRYFSDRAFPLERNLIPYFVMPVDQDTPKYFHIRAFFWQQVLISAVTAFYFGTAIQNLLHKACISSITACLWFAVQLVAYPVFASRRSKNQIAH